MKKTWMMKVGSLLLSAAMLAACSNAASGNGNNGETAAATAAASASAQTGEAAVDVGDGVGVGQTNIDFTQAEVEIEEEDTYTDWASDSPTTIRLDGTGAVIEGSGAAADAGTITIQEAGTYAVSGKLDDGRIVVDVQDKGLVRLVLNGAELHSSTTAPIYVKEAGKLVVSLPEGTVNRVSDGENYAYPDASTDEPNAAIFSRDDLTINGGGKLVVEGNYKDGIASKDKLLVTGGTIGIHAVDDGIVGKDLAAIQAGDLTIQTEGHGIKASDDTEGEEGVINVRGGALHIVSGEDALHSSGRIFVSGGSLAIQAGDDGLNADLFIAVTGGTIDIAESNEGIESARIEMAGGEVHVVASDDGVNVSSGTSAEAGGGAPGEGMPGGAMGRGNPGAAMPDGAPAPGDGNPSAATASGNKLVISGGYLSVDAQGDGLDANGSIEMSGGTVVVNGPTANGNGPLDYDGTFLMTGGFLVAAGSAGMAQAASEASTQYGVMMTFPQDQPAGTVVSLQDAEGQSIAVFAPTKSYRSVYVSSPELKKGGSYSLLSGGTPTGSGMNGLYQEGGVQGGTEVVSFEVSTMNTWLNESGVTEAGSGMMRGPGGGRGRFGPGGGGAPAQ